MLGFWFSWFVGWGLLVFLVVCLVSFVFLVFIFVSVCLVVGPLACWFVSWLAGCCVGCSMFLLLFVMLFVVFGGFWFG